MPRAKKPDPKSEPQRAACATCGYFIRQHTDKAMQADYGDCRRYPPTIVNDPDDGMASVWPIVELADACGEWRARMNA